MCIISGSHLGCGDCNTAHRLRCHLGIDRTNIKVLENFYWENVGKDANDFVLSCDQCQKANPVHKICVGGLHPDPVPSEVVAQIILHFTKLPKTGDGYCCIALKRIIFPNGSRLDH